ncbi:hypothetical protein T440DRAFT_505771 [Plenodomus tracheiphilus IPT5]|uniref:NACHT domain-containing protein n=1 Tax=Plenodomus tracheiphilus IPT5 TaxID=1408161 RepID=A0A6A7BDJ3_9PLEO|nr:hypothetical protein T440DRAFT_505771 [Plenodomus tracheiphilus IPT5]
MEPLSALSIATAVVQFLDFAGKLVSGTWTIYRGQPSNDAGGDSDIKTIMESLTKVTRKLQVTSTHNSLTPWSSQDVAITALAKRCTSVGEQLLELLEQLHSRSQRQFWDSFCTALRTIWSEKQVARLRQTLDSYRQQISMHMLVAMREQISSANVDQRESLTQTQNICRDVLRKVTERAQWQNDLFKAIQRSHSIRAHNALHDAPPGKIHMNLSSVDATWVIRSILETMYFPEIERRYEKITAAYQNTFDWIFLDPFGDDIWTDFPGWMRDDGGSLYWITGKAGAGKSTLMRYIYDHTETRKALKIWAGSRELIVAYFFFWNSGSAMQMSHEGMVRSLLYQVLQQVPDLVPYILPHRMEIGTLFGVDAVDSKTYGPWSWDELQQAFRRLIKQCSKSYRLAFFIDGMDEFQGNPMELIEFISNLITPGIKICASSRPWVVFEDAFGHQSHLRLENLTHNDIKVFVTSKMTASPGFRALQDLDAQISTTLIENVCRKSSGVFLWVSLVTQSLLDGLSEGERLSELQDRLDSLPSDLEKLFENILGRLDRKHFERAAQFFEMVRVSLRPLLLLDMSFADEDDLDLVNNVPRGPLSASQMTSRAELMRRRINACCKGLLEAKSNKRTQLADTEVGFLHRTVKDYLEQQDTAAKLYAAIKPTFNVNLRLCNSQLLSLKHQNQELLTNDILWRSVSYAIEYAIRAYPTDSERQVSLLNNLDKVATGLTTTPLHDGRTYLQQSSLPSQEATHWTWTKVKCPEPSFLGLAAQLGLTGYVFQMLQSMPPEQIREEVPKLLRVVGKKPSGFTLEYDHMATYGRETYEVVKVLADFNSEYGKDPPLHNSKPGPRKRLMRWFKFS